MEQLALFAAWIFDSSVQEVLNSIYSALVILSKALQALEVQTQLFMTLNISLCNVMLSS